VAGDSYLSTSGREVQRRLPVLPKHRIECAYRRTLRKHPVMGTFGGTHRRPQRATAKLTRNGRGSGTPTGRLQTIGPSTRFGRKNPGKESLRLAVFNEWPRRSRRREEQCRLGLAQN
jgi:hypothetical protein